MNQLQAAALNEGLHCKKRLWREAGREQLATRSMTGEFRSVDLRVLAKSPLSFKLTDPVTIKM